MSKNAKQSKSKRTTAAPATLGGLTPAQSRALRLVRKGSKFTVRDVADALLQASENPGGGGGTSLSLARAHVRAWQGAGYVTASTQGSQGVVGVYKRVK